MGDDRPVRLGVAGIGGYARSIRGRALSFGPEISPRVELAAVCDPDLGPHAETVRELREHGVLVHDSFAAMLEEDIDAVWLPLPIQLHRPFTEQALAAGKAVMCEKPAAGTIDEVDAMIAARDAAQLPVLIGFQDVYAPETAPLKQRILDGEFGRIIDATVWACWPRSTVYFGRSAWAGKIRVGDTWILDSPANNALAHFINVTLFLLGPSPERSATPESVYAELYRAADIESYDTCSLEAHVEGGARMTVNFTHACQEQRHPIITLHGESATIHRSLSEIRIKRTGQQDEVIACNSRAMQQAVMQKYAQTVRGVDDPSIAAATLEVARQHTVLINGVAEASVIQPLPSDLVQTVTDERGGTIRCVPGIEDAFANLAANRQTMHASGLFEFTTPGSTKDLHGYHHFAGSRETVAS